MKTMNPEEIQMLKDLTLFWVIPWAAGVFVLACIAERIWEWWKEMKTLIMYLLTAILFLSITFAWTSLAYQYLSMAQEIQELKADVDNCERRWSRDFSKKHGLIE